MRSTTIIFAAVAALAQFVAATPPACLIAAVGVQSNPADVKVLCGTGKDWVIGNITESCSDETERTALTTFKSTCDGAGYTIALPSATATSTSTSASKTSSAGSSKTSSAGSSTTSSATSASGEDEDVSDVWGDSANGTTTTTGKGSVAGGNGTEEGGATHTGAGAALSAGSSIFLGSMIAVAGLASQLL